MPITTRKPLINGNIDHGIIDIRIHGINKMEDAYQYETDMRNLLNDPRTPRKVFVMSYQPHMVLNKNHEALILNFSRLFGSRIEVVIVIGDEMRKVHHQLLKSKYGKSLMRFDIAVAVNHAEALHMVQCIRASGNGGRSLP